MVERDDLWSDAELKACADAYVHMLNLTARREKFVKRRIVTQLLSGPLARRTRGAVEFRFQNISSIRAELGLAWVKGFPPHANVGPTNKKKLVELLRRHGVLESIYADPNKDWAGNPGIQATKSIAIEAESEKSSNISKATNDPEELDRRVRELRERKSSAAILASVPKGKAKPRSTQTAVRAFYRDPEVKAWILENARGICEGCGERAPFQDEYNRPFLEVHHLAALASGGPDTIWNTVALCPNCHRRMHSSNDRSTFTMTVSSRIIRPGAGKRDEKGRT